MPAIYRAIQKGISNSLHEELLSPVLCGTSLGYWTVLCPFSGGDLTDTFFRVVFAVVNPVLVTHGDSCCFVTLYHDHTAQAVPGGGGWTLLNFSTLPFSCGESWRKSCGTSRRRGGELQTAGDTADNTFTTLTNQETPYLWTWVQHICLLQAGHCSEMTNPCKSIYSFSMICSADVIKDIKYEHSKTIVPTSLWVRQLSTDGICKHPHPCTDAVLAFAEGHSNTQPRVGRACGLRAGSICP